MGLGSFPPALSSYRSQLAPVRVCSQGGKSSTPFTPLEATAGSLAPRTCPTCTESKASGEHMAPDTVCEEASEPVPQEGASKRGRLHPQPANAHLWLTVVLTAFQNQNSKIEVVWAAPASSQLGPLQKYRPFLGLSLERRQSSSVQHPPIWASSAYRKQPLCKSHIHSLCGVSLNLHRFSHWLSQNR